MWGAGNPHRRSLPFSPTRSLSSPSSSSSASMNRTTTVSSDQSASSQRSQLLDDAEIVPAPLQHGERGKGGKDLPAALQPSLGDLSSFAGPSSAASTSSDTSRSRSPSPVTRTFRRPSSPRQSPFKPRRASFDLPSHSSSRQFSFRQFFSPSTPLSSTNSTYAAVDHWLDPIPSSSSLKSASPSTSPAVVHPPRSPARTVSFAPILDKSNTKRPASAGSGAVLSPSADCYEQVSRVHTSSGQAAPSPHGPLPLSSPLGSSPPTFTPLVRSRSHSSTPPPTSLSSPPSHPTSSSHSSFAHRPPSAQAPSSLDGLIMSSLSSSVSSVSSTSLPASSLSPSKPRSRFLQSSTASKLVKRANRQSRFMTLGSSSALSAEGLSGGKGGGIGAGLAPPLEEEVGEGVGGGASLKSGSTSRHEKEKEGEEAGFYEEYHPTGGLSMEVQPYARDLPYFVSYSHASQNWDALRTSSLFLGSVHGSTAYPIELLSSDGSKTRPLVEPPKKVLDVASGAAPHFVLKMARSWQETEFVALDAAPSSITSPDLLPPDLASRIQTVQHDFREKFPFEDGEFDYVRLAFPGLALSEQEWASVIEESMRVLKSGCLFEVVEQDYSVWRKRSTGDDPDQSTTSFGQPHQFAGLDKIYGEILDDRFINPSPLTVIPSDLAMNGTNLRSTGRIAFPIPSHPPSYDASVATPLPETSNDPVFDTFNPQLEKYAAGSSSTSTLLKINEVRVTLAAYADLWASSSYGIAHAAVLGRHRKKSRERSTSHRSRTSSFGGSTTLSSSDSLSDAAFQKDVRDVEDLVHTWTDDLRQRAGVAELLSSRMGWVPAFDRQALSAYESQLPEYDAKLAELNAQRHIQEDVFGEVEPEVEQNIQRVKFQRREAEVELETVKTRLYGPEGRRDGQRAGKEEEEETLGKFELAAFVVNNF
ncbi:hypothetical protein JCM8547_003595 [Rhodosporidiobolus lusitaniae]